MKRFSIVVYIIFLLIACVAPKKIKTTKHKPIITETTNEIPNAPDIDTVGAATLMVDLQKTGCTGKCPVFKIEIFSNGKISYIGEKYADMKGRYESQLDNFTYKMLFDRAKHIHFFQLANQYPENNELIKELPNTMTFIKLGNFEKRIINNHDAPIELQEYEQFLQSLVDVLEWKRSR
jgi:Domain of unknown function (DUF6438)